MGYGGCHRKPRGWSGEQDLRKRWNLVGHGCHSQPFSGPHGCAQKWYPKPPMSPAGVDQFRGKSRGRHAMRTWPWTHESR